MSRGTGSTGHDAVVGRIPDLLAGNVRWWERRWLNRQLRSCTDCQAEMETYRQIDQEFKRVVPEYLNESQPSAELLERVEATIDHYPVSRRSRVRTGITRIAVPAAAALAVVAVIVLAMTLSGGGASALSLATPVKGTVLVTEGGAAVADGEFAYVSPALWERNITNLRAPQAVGAVSEVSVGGETYVRVGNGPWRSGDETPAIRQPIPGLGDLGQTERLFDAVLNLYKLEKGGQREFRGERLTEFRGVDSGYAARLRDAELASGASEVQITPLFDLYDANPPEVTVLADDDELIQAILIVIPLLDSPNPLFVQVVIEESNASVEIAPPSP